MCNHEWKKHKIARSVAGRTEKFFGEKCSLCGTVAWTKNAEAKYRLWIKDLVKKEAFKVQNVGLTVHSLQAIATIKEKLLVNSDSGILKGCIGFYLSEMMSSESMVSMALEALKNTDQSLEKNVDLKISPALYLKLEALGKLGDQSVREVVEDIVNMVLSKVPAYYQALENHIAVAA